MTTMNSKSNIEDAIRFCADLFLKPIRDYHAENDTNEACAHTPRMSASGSSEKWFDHFFSEDRAPQDFEEFRMNLNDELEKYKALLYAKSQSAGDPAEPGTKTKQAMDGIRKRKGLPDLEQYLDKL
jgi:hypothetical protein